MKFKKALVGFILVCTVAVGIIVVNSGELFPPINSAYGELFPPINIEDAVVVPVEKL